MARSIIGLEAQIESCLVLISGDVSYSGDEEQFGLAHNFICELAKCLSDLLPWRVGATPTVHVAVAPGNHDCAFGTKSQQETREMVLDGLQKKPDLASSTDAIKLCLEPQRPFSEFLEAISTTPATPSVEGLPQALCYDHLIEVGQSKVRVLCVNSAWCSRLKEGPGTLIYPTEALSFENLSHADATLVMLHHPYQWFVPAVRRSLRHILETVASVVLTGHEHVPDKYSQTREIGETVEFIEGGALAEHGSSRTSEFNVLLLDLKTSQQKLIHLAWTGEAYDIRPSSGPSPDWRPFQGAQQRSARTLRFTPEHAALLDDAGIALKHRAKEEVTLRDIFVFPDVHRHDERPDPSTTTVIPGDRLLHEISELRRVAISGDSDSGRTALSKVLCQVFREKGRVPILLSPEAAPPPSKTALDWVQMAAEQQYGKASARVLHELSPSERVVVIDDFHKLSLGRNRKRRFLDSLCSLSETVVLTLHDLALDVEELDDANRLIPEALEFTHLRLVQMGHVKRDELVRRVLLLGDSAPDDPEAFAARREAIVHRLNTLIGQRFVPSHPIIVLSVLQGEEASQPLDPQASSYGHFYEMFIKIGLMKNATGRTYEFRSALLSVIANEYRQSRRRILSRSAVLATIRTYLEERDLREDAERILKDLLHAQMLASSCPAELSSPDLAA